MMALITVEKTPRSLNYTNAMEVSAAIAVRADI
jgi:hypothetical protein